MSGSAFQTGNPEWNHALGTLAGGLFPDPTKIAQSGYYGAEARKAQIEGYQKIQEINAANRALMMNPGAGGSPGPITYQQPPIVGMGPIMAPPNLPMAPGVVAQPPMGIPPPPAPGAAPPGAAPAPAPTPMPPPTLGQTVSGGGQGGPPAVPPPTPTGALPSPGPGAVSEGGVAVGGSVPPPLPPAETLARLLAPGSSPNPKGIGMTGQPPPSSPPSAVSPPAPNTTTSNGQTPKDSLGDGPIHPGTFTEPDGGKKYSAPAAPNGSPAPINFDMGTYMALQAMAGRNPDMARAQLIGYVVDAENRGIIPMGSASRLSSFFGAPTYETEQSTLRTRINDTGATTRQGMVIAGEKERLGMTPQNTVDPTGQPTFTTTAAINAAPPGTVRSYQPNYNTNLLERDKFQQTPLPVQGRDANGRPTAIMPGGAYTGQPIYSPTGYTTDQSVTVGGSGSNAFSTPILLKNQDIQSGQPGYNAQVAVTGAAPVEVYRTKPDGTPDISQPAYKTTTADAITNKLPITPNNSDQVTAFVRQGVLAGPQDASVERLSTTIAGTTPPTVPKTAEEGVKTLNARNKFIEDTYRPQDIIKGRQETAELTPEGKFAVNDYADYLMRKNPRMTPENATVTATTYLQNEGYIPTPQQSAAARSYTVKGALQWGNPNIELQVKKGQVAGKWMIPLLKDYRSELTGVTAKSGQSPEPLAPTTSQPQSGRVIGPAPAGATEGQQFTKNGRTAVVRNGQLVEQ